MASYCFLFNDDVQFIKGGWINRNRILDNGSDTMITVPVQKFRSIDHINEVNLSEDPKWRPKMLNKVKNSYQHAPFYDQVFPVLSDLIEKQYKSIAGLAEASVCTVMRYLNLDFQYDLASSVLPSSSNDDRSLRLIKLTKASGCSTYVNPISGKSLYDKAFFKHHGVELEFMESELSEYKQYNNSFVPWLSILDVMMFNSPEDIVHHLYKFKLR